MKRVKCIRNDSKTLPFRVNQIYSVGYDFVGGLFEIYDGRGSVIQAPLNGYYLEFIEIN
ncbi:hypothetical protein Shfl1p68 [Shigella phage Shfl1]|uniref:DUF7244 domain-containing protein n=1 Tax=Shigella phage Shfl1 TaxID=2919551 RepID=F2VX16_9CAUD|nr:hypothetical protein Shfl1p68 [Shigella phage Shfl1]AEA72944.1 hypothetical protein Shfl1p68 [Shigella phage Shfl1]